MTLEEKTSRLQEIAMAVQKYKGLDIAISATHGVPGEGDPQAKIMFIGEAPGFHEDQQGRPFVGQAGKLLEKTLAETLGLNRSQVYITNIVKYRPPDNRDPFPEEIAACSGWLDQQIQIIEPKIIATLGRFSMAKFIPGVSISQTHGQPRFVDFLGTRYIVFPMYHPAAALRSGQMMNEFKSDFAKLQRLLDSSPAVSTPPAQVTTPSQASLF